jgi:indolepyruvate ferredoxin oxidoreductase
MVPPDDAISNEKTLGVDYNFALDDRYTKSDGTVYLTGMQALVRLLIEQIDLDRRQGLRTRGYVSGYRGSPVSGRRVKRLPVEVSISTPASMKISR